MLGIDKVIQAVEAKILNSLQDRLKIAITFDPKDLTCNSVSHWDGRIVNKQSFDLEPMVEAIEKRIKTKRKK
jgi:hypothetical protein